MKIMPINTVFSFALFANQKVISRAFSFRHGVFIDRSRSHLTRQFSTAIQADEAGTATNDQIDADVLNNIKDPFLITMRDRGFMFQCTNLKDLDEYMTNHTTSAYLGFDATADSLHVGSLTQIMILRHLQKSGHRPVVLIGGGTSKVGDPTGKDESRKLLDDDAIQKNTDGISKVFEKFITFGESPTDAMMVNNDDWLSSLKYLEFLRDYGTQFTINRMMSFESVKQRMARDGDPPSKIHKYPHSIQRGINIFR